MENLFAELTPDNTVLRIVVMPDGATETECAALLGGTWKQTYADGRKYKNYASPGQKYNPILDAFIPPKPTYSLKTDGSLDVAKEWTLDTVTAKWKPQV